MEEMRQLLESGRGGRQDVLRRQHYHLVKLDIHLLQLRKGDAREDLKKELRGLVSLMEQTRSLQGEKSKAHLLSLIRRMAHMKEKELCLDSIDCISEVCTDEAVRCELAGLREEVSK